MLERSARWPHVFPIAKGFSPPLDGRESGCKAAPALRTILMAPTVIKPLSWEMD